MRENGRGLSLRTAIVGAGLMGRWHADAVRRVGGQVVVVVDRDLGRAGALARQYPGAVAVADLAEAIQGASARPNGGIDVVHLCSPSSTHVGLAIEAIENGAHVLAEKPLAPTAGATAALLDLCEKRERLICPTHQFLFQRGVCRAFQDHKVLGQLVHVDYTTCSAGATTSSDEERDRIASEILPHPLSLLTRLFNGELHMAQLCSRRVAPGEMRVWGSTGLTSVSVTISMGGRPTMNTMHLIGHRGSVHLDLFHGFGIRERGTSSRRYKAARPLLVSGMTAYAAFANLFDRVIRAESAYPGLRELIRGFYSAVLGLGSPPISKREIMDVASARDALLAQMNFRN